jgi:hypothetical protein
LHLIYYHRKKRYKNVCTFCKFFQIYEQKNYKYEIEISLANPIQKKSFGIYNSDLLTFVLLLNVTFILNFMVISTKMFKLHNNQKYRFFLKKFQMKIFFMRTWIFEFVNFKIFNIYKPGS